MIGVLIDPHRQEIYILEPEPKSDYPSNATTPEPYHLAFRSPRLEKYRLDPIAARTCLETTIRLAHTHPPDTPLPRGAGFKIAEAGIWLEAHGYTEAYTWRLLEYTVKLVWREFKARGVYRCSWEVERMEGEGEPGVLVGWGKMWSDYGDKDGE
ncbi:MAG: hypothetical protein Q9182_005441 [Xanthomendoza sp. 2 TL-2023]